MIWNPSTEAVRENHSVGFMETPQCNNINDDSSSSLASPGAVFDISTPIGSAKTEPGIESDPEQESREACREMPIKRCQRIGNKPG